ncbi:MAG: glutamate racemase [Alphaproteobacteria bacterium]
MKLGVFDSGLGGLVITKSIRAILPDIDILYFGDTLHIPYGNRSSEAIYEYSKRSIEYLFEQECALIIVACNTVSASALRRLQQEYLPNSPYHDRRILGVVVPTLECAIEKGYKNIGLIATNYTIQSNIFEYELKKLDPDIHITQKNTPLLVPLIENDGGAWIPSVLEYYLNSFKSADIDALILGCTHYPFLKNHVQNFLGNEVDILSQDEIIPHKLVDYLNRHPEISNKIERKGALDFIISDVTEGYINASSNIYGDNINIKNVALCHKTNRYRSL